MCLLVGYIRKILFHFVLYVSYYISTIPFKSKLDYQFAVQNTYLWNYFIWRIHVYSRYKRLQIIPNIYNLFGITSHHFYTLEHL